MNPELLKLYKAIDAEILEETKDLEGESLLDLATHILGSDNKLVIKLSEELTRIDNNE